MKNLISIRCVLTLILILSPIAMGRGDQDLKKLVQTFTTEYKALGIPVLEISYVDQFKTIQDSAGLARQTAFFQRSQAQLKAIPQNQLSKDYRIQHQILEYEIRQNFV